MSRRVARAVGALACVASTMLFLAHGAAADRAAGSTAAHRAAEGTASSRAQPTGTNVLGLVSQTPVVEPDGDLVIRLRVSGAPSGATIRVDVHGAVPTRTDFQASLQGKFLRAPVQGSPLLFPAATDPAGTAVLDIATRDPQSATPADPSTPTIRVGEGVFPVTISLVDERTTIQQLTTYLVRLPATHDFPPLGVAMVLPVQGPPALQPDGSVHLDEQTGVSVLGEASVLAAHPDVPLTLAPTGDTLDALEPSTAAALKSDLAGREITSTPYVQLSPSAWLSGGLHDPLGRAFDLGTSATTRVLAPATTSVYVADTTINPDAVRFLRARGVTSMVVPDTALSPLDPRVFNRTLTQPFDIDASGGVEGIAADTALAAHMGSTGDPVVDANHLLADLAVLYYDDPPDRRAAAFVLAGDRAVDPRFLDALLASLSPSANRMAQPMTLSTAFATVPRVGSRDETTGRGTPLSRRVVPAATEALGDYPGRLRAVERDIGSYGTMLVGPNPRPDDLERRAIVGGATGLSGEERDAYVSGAAGGVRAETSKVGAPPRQTINFTARDGVVSLTIRVTTGYPVRIDCLLQGEKLEFPGHEDGHLTLTLTQETTRIPIDVRTRVSGDTQLDVTLQTPDGGIVLDRSRITVRSTAFSGVGVVLSIGAGAFLALWWGRHIITSRRARRRQPKHAAGA